MTSRPAAGQTAGVIDVDATTSDISVADGPNVVDRSLRLLPFHGEIVEQMINQDALLVMGAGLGLNQVLVHLIRAYATQHLVIVVNTSDTDELELIQALGSADDRGEGTETLGDAQVRAMIVNNETSSAQREKLYTQKGCLFVRMRILTVDLLAKRVPHGAVGGLIVNGAHMATPESHLAFIIQLLRESNKSAFIKGLTESPTMVTRTYRGLEKIVKVLYADTVFLWPRFHSSVVSTFEARAPDVVELAVNLTPSMHAIQDSIVSAIEACLQELGKSSLDSVDFSDLSVRDSLHRSFDYAVRQKLDPVWHKISRKMKQLVSDLAMLRKLVEYLVTYDCVTFHTTLQTMLAGLEDHSPLLFLDATQRIVRLSKKRLYTFEENKLSEPNGKRVKASQPMGSTGAVEPQVDGKAGENNVALDPSIYRQLTTVVEEITSAARIESQRKNYVPDHRGALGHDATHFDRGDHTDDGSRGKTMETPKPSCETLAPRTLSRDGHTLTVTAEPDPKIQILKKVLQEIEMDRRPEDARPVVVLTRDDATCAFVKEMLSEEDQVGLHTMSMPLMRWISVFFHSLFMWCTVSQRNY